MYQISIFIIHNNNDSLKSASYLQISYFSVRLTLLIFAMCMWCLVNLQSIKAHKRHGIAQYHGKKLLMCQSKWISISVPADIMVGKYWKDQTILENLTHDMFLKYHWSEILFNIISVVRSFFVLLYEWYLEGYGHAFSANNPSNKNCITSHKQLS